ncbi:MAG: hypothetical protein H0T46_28855 [Deltaproteobacteria bacterium]|nr:hypothetical protein [Deltaproteobacteria bacterium]
MRTRLAWLMLVSACGPSARGGLPDASGGGDEDAPAAIDAAPHASGPVHVVITADNAYSFGYGDVSNVTHFTQGQRAQTAGQIFNCPIGEGPEVYTIPEADAPDGAYLYIVTWDDLSVTQGVLGTFARDSGTVITGDPRFEVCATGIDYSSGANALTGPTQAIINTEIARCNAGTGAAGTTSKGWVNSAGPVTTGALGTLAVGEMNDDQTGTFPITCQPTAATDGIASNAKWMWYDPADGAGGDAFHSTGQNRFKAFLIFRLGVADIIL